MIMQKLISTTEILAPMTSQLSCQLICYYKNTTSQIQTVRISNIPNWYFERVVFPGERLLFEASPEAELEIHTGTLVGKTLADKILCCDLQVQN
jgi:hypothetical protein